MLIKIFNLNCTEKHKINPWYYVHLSGMHLKSYPHFVPQHPCHEISCIFEITCMLQYNSCIQ